MDSERERFRVYVEKSGVMSSLTDALVRLYELPQKPDDALDFIKKTLGQNNADTHKVALLEERIKELEGEVKSLQDQLGKQKEADGVKKESQPPVVPPQ